ncbi:MAG: hypothetical protein K6A69_04815 [Lachnospiraceae bacterium]|nr:hypothetical protein [Lachnospiraceae bacterium]
MSLKKWKKLNLDSRTAPDIEKEISNLADQYDTVWTPDYEKPDIGTAIAKVFAGQMEENIGYVNEVLDRYHTEFVNMLDLTLLPAKPSSTIVVMEMLSDTVPGTAVPKGTKLITNGEEPYIFETDHSLYVTSSRINAVFMADGEEGTIIPLYGNFERPLLPGEKIRVKDDNEAEDEDEDIDIDETEDIREETIKPFTLFGEDKGIEQNVAAFYHSTVFDTGREDIFVRIEGNDELVDDIDKGVYQFFYRTKNAGVLPMEHVKLLEDHTTFVLNKEKEENFETLYLKADAPPAVAKSVKRISFSSRGRADQPEAVNSGSTDFNPLKFEPFTPTLSLYAECYIGHDRYFSKAGARITIKFDLLFEENRISLTTDEETGELKVIKRRPNSARNSQFADCYAQEISMEYFNGTGWKKLSLSDDPHLLFLEDKAKKVELTFTCPDDWEPTSYGSFEGRAIRLVLLKSDNCYVRPATHHYPIIQGMTIEYTYEEHYVDPQKVEMFAGTKRFDITDRLHTEKGYTILKKTEYEDDALYIGISRRIDNGPVSIFFQLEDNNRFSGLKCRFEYHGYDGWRQMKVLDHTSDFTRSGTVMFMPPSDMKQVTLEGQNCFWIRVLRVKKEMPDENRQTLPRVENICLNAVQVSNVETRPEVALYIEEILPNMRFALGTTNVLDADVWVNEFGKFSRDTMLSMKADRPDDIEIEYDMRGQITSFFVRWHETDRLETSEDPRVYLLDRLNNELIFGDGIHTYIPRVTDNTAIHFTVRCCNGSDGNVDALSIADPLGNLNYIGDIRNPIKAYGGSNIETLENALERGASILSSRNRLVSVDDYSRAILSYSDTIDQVSCIVGTTEDGTEDDGEVSFILLMKDFEEGSYAFHRVMSGIKKDILDRCELTVVPEKLHIVEPVFVDISINVWVNVVSIDESFEIQNLLQECLESYLNPLGYSDSRGWKIGTVPKKPQILMKLSILKSRAIVKKSVMIAHYADKDGDHEVDLEDLKVSPFMVCRSGKHQVHIIY